MASLLVTAQLFSQAHEQFLMDDSKLHTVAHSLHEQDPAPTRIWKTILWGKSVVPDIAIERVNHYYNCISAETKT
jgi:hypothetical protein